MENSLVVLRDKVPVTTSLIIADGMKIEHRAIMYLIRKYESKFLANGEETFAIESKKSGGRPTEYAVLSESNAVAVITLMRNSDIVVDFKFKLSAAFAKYRRLITDIFIQNQDIVLKEQRQMSKVQRLQETGVIRTFVEYAKAQGSKNAEMYYCNLTKMENQALFFIMEKFPNLRDVMDVPQLIAIGAADQAVLKALMDGMAENLPYKEIFQRAKVNVMKIADAIGKSPLPKQITFKLTE